ncbi:EAL domain-containing protein [Pseudanabaena sp. lw0831]|uniref:EAL domain-containing protein n=1 Tax=Pseudanabaena sp. lw0831 TaxID=1357935 RepID=UPI001914ED65|nr:EAL domain-containing protein [Pseudanabaena sp. lw0831]
MITSIGNVDSSRVGVASILISIFIFISVFISLIFPLVPVKSSHELFARELSDTSAVVSLNDRQAFYSLSKYLEFFEDKDSNLTIEQISSAEFSKQFKQSDRDPPSFGYSTSIFWARLQLYNSSELDAEWVLSFEYPQIDRIELYLPSPQQIGGWISKKSGLLYPFSARDISDRLPAFSIPISAKTSQNIYIQLQTTTPLIIQANLRNLIGFWQYRGNQNIWIGLIYGSLIFAILYNFFLFTALQDPVYLYYIIFATGAGLILFAYDGFGIQYVWQSAVWWNKHAIAILAFPTSLCLIQWICLFLETKSFMPQCHRILRSQQILLTVIFLSIFILPFQFVSVANTVGILITCSLAIMMGIFAVKRGYSPARYYLLSFSFFPLGVIAHQLSQLNVIPAFEWIRDIYRVGIVASVVFLSLALADRINLLKAEKLRAQKHALAEKDILNEDLKRSQEQLLEREKQLEYDVLHDALTGLANRTWLTQRLQDLLQQQQQKFAILFIDLDRFKVINDSLGHLVGDELLKYATIRMQSILPNFGTLTRFGGDEFVILLEELTDLESITKLADLLQMQLQLPFYLNNYELFISASIGINLSTEEYKQPEEIIRDADLAMYQAKHKGRRRYELFTQSDRIAAMTRLNLESDLRRALDKNEFYLMYQPIVSLQTQQICGYEALVRWKNSAGQQISPSEFIPITEETGLINSLGWWIMQEVCQQTQLWNQQLNNSNNMNLSINVNVSPIQLRQLDFIKTLKQILIETGLPNHCLKLEITESCLLENIDSDTNLLQDLKDLGIRLCIDDFGTGYSSLSRLHDLPIDTLKIDQSFVKRIGSESDSAVIIETIISLAQSLNMHTVAEGVETRSQLDKLIAIGCNFGQGYLFSRPCDLATASKILQNGLTCAID